MSVAGVTNVTNSSTTQTGKSSNFVSKDDFLKILISQIKYQDPLDPLKPDQFLTQLSQLTQVEQLQNISSLLEVMNKSNASGNITQWLSAIGKKMSVDGQVLSRGDEVYLAPQGDYDEVLLTLQNSSTGSTKEVRISKGEALVYRHEGDETVLFGAVALKNNKAVSCTPKVFRKIAAVELVDSQPVMLASNGDSYSVSQINKIKE